jgi:hypothetical protein
MHEECAPKIEHC